MLKLIISGGQTGADRAGWRAARRFGIQTSGWMPRGFLAEDGPHPEFRELYGVREMSTASYPDRTRANVHGADAALWFGDHESPGGKATFKAIRDLLMGPWLIIRPGIERFDWKYPDVARFIKVNHVEKLMVAGNRESKAPGIGAWVEAYLCEVFRLLGHQEAARDG